MMHAKKEEYATKPSTIISEISPFEAYVVLLDRQESALKVYLEKIITCPTKKHVSFVGRLITTLSASKLFAGTAVLEAPEESLHPFKAEYFSEEHILRHSVSLLSRYRICYSFIARCDDPDRFGVNAQVEVFRKECETVHEKLEEFAKKYRIQNRINYWMFQLAAALKKKNGNTLSGGLKVEQEVEEGEEGIIDHSFNPLEMS